ncbi:TPA: hypothetical protein DEP94_00335 [Candidatus Nomurabacteria bacterium]|nr:hypothetical protein [Candidatus Nomurabacteria bacterium]
MSESYQPLDSTEQAIISTPNKPFGFTVGQPTNLSDTFAFVLFFMLAASGVAAMGRVIYALSLRVLNSDDPAKVTAANKIITTSLTVLLGSFSLVVLFMAVNPDVVSGNLDFSKITVMSMRAGSQLPVLASGGVSSTGASCSDESIFKKSVSTSGEVCLTNTCEALKGCDTTTYASIINLEATKQGVNPKLVTVLMCRESRGIVSPPVHTNTDGSVDCGLMQINKKVGGCTQADLDPATNIAKGVALIKEKYSLIKQSYPGITRDMMVSASYNCCGSGNPNDQSSDCTPASGYPYTLPKWACPIDPGKTSTNMCFVKNYVCDVATCLSKL